VPSAALAFIDMHTHPHSQANPVCLQRGYKSHMLTLLPKLANLDGERNPVSTGRSASVGCCTQPFWFHTATQATFTFEPPFPWFTDAQLNIPNPPKLAGGLKLMERFEEVQRHVESVSQLYREVQDAWMQEYKQVASGHR
jgi:hypothetical protein